MLLRAIKTGSFIGVCSLLEASNDKSLSLGGDEEDGLLSLSLLNDF